MKDRFKFRAWDKKHGIMVYCEEEASREQIHEYEALYDWDEDYGCWEYKCLSGLESLIRDDNFIVEQCTGLRDRNGKLIYEGDILKGGYAKYKVVWQGSGFVLKVKTAGGYPLGGSADLLEVIGNIHENADLLENKE